MAEEKKAATAEVCAGCGKPVGPDAAPTPSGKGKFCRPCSYRSAMGAVEEDVAAKQAIIEAVEPDREGPGRVRRTIGLVLLLAVLGGIAVVWTPVVSDAVAGKRYYAVGAADAADPALQACLGALWEIRVALDRYVGAHDGKLPAALVELPGIEDQCPATDRPWVYERGEDGAYRIACPDPSALGRGAILLDHRYGPPRVLSSGEVISK